MHIVDVVLMAKSDPLVARSIAMHVFSNFIMNKHQPNDIRHSLVGSVRLVVVFAHVLHVVVVVRRNYLLLI